VSSRLLVPPEITPIDGPLVFLAGPIQGAPDWQSDAIALLQTLAPELHIASPRLAYLDGTFVYERQVDWETHHLRLAARTGAILFWLAREVEHRCDRAYAQTTRFELAEWKRRHECEGVKLVVGIEHGFSGARYIRHRFAQDCPAVPICTSLEPTCRALLDLLSVAQQT
jgi:hypothetical protein